MTDFDLVIQNGNIISDKESYFSDIGISAGKIEKIGHHLSGRVFIDASGKIVLPGAVDPHVHLEMPVGLTTSSDDWESGTIAAACGGTTTIIDFIEPEGNQTLLHALTDRRNQALGRSVIDFGLHMTITNSDENTLDQIPGVVSAGVPSFKVYTTYEGFLLNDQELLDVMETVKNCGGMVMVHAENDAIIKHKQKSFLMEGKLSPRYHPLSRPDIAEAEAIHRVIALAKVAGVKLYIVHISTALGANEISSAISGGHAIIGETCPQYLLLTDDEYERSGFEGAKYVCSPPLRKSADQSALWNALSLGTINTIGTDHCPFLFNGQKELGIDKFTKIPGGMPGIETRLALLYTFGVAAGRITINQWVNLCCTMPAKIFGIYPQKGGLSIGADADVIIFDPEKEVIISNSRLHEHVDYSPYEGMKLRGYPEMTIFHGNVVVRDGEFVGNKGQGKFLAGSPVLYESVGM